MTLVKPESLRQVSLSSMQLEAGASDASTNFHALLISLFDNAPVNRALGVTLEYNAESEAVCRGRRNPTFDHGGHDSSSASGPVAMATASFAKLGELPAR